MGMLNLFGGDKQETTYNTTQSWQDSNNTTISSARSMENVGNTTIALPGTGALGGGVTEYIVIAIAGVLLLVGVALALRQR